MDSGDAQTDLPPPLAADNRRSRLLRPALVSGLVALVTLLTVKQVLLHRHAREQAASRTYRIGILSDTHVAGPEYALNGENGPLDNASITKTQQRLHGVVAALKAVSPAPQLTVFGGDVVHNGLDRLRHLGMNSTGLAALLSEPVNGYTIAAAILRDLQSPKLFAWGNHDGLVTCGDAEASISKQLTERLARYYFGAELYSSHNLGPHWKVVALHSMQGYTWDPKNPRCDTVLSSYGKAQLRWLDGQLAEGRHTILVMHHPLVTTVNDEVPEHHQGWRDLRTLLAAHDNVRLVLSGHNHKGVDWQDLYPFPALTLPSTRYNPQNFLILDLLPNGSHVWADPGKNRGGSRCSDYWSYDVKPRHEAEWQARDAGDCGMPAAGNEADFPLAPVLNASAIPSQEVFNPERSCQFVLAKRFLPACAKGAAQDCCDVVADQWRLSSSAPFTSCFCQPRFWQESVSFMREQYGVDLAATLLSCVSDYGKQIVWRGGPLTWCPA
ncbi:hypothetical protein D9Q98_005058 [Chlorella vulgaris]|uniref:Calcineurin-like phosphoesterase domain-containing protein n=1 Tax=Chlorella vulgaris TaxID=3077 RepID=A0A9D4TND7_CHLVU|nr:hypothetical protein D9Q98_005058 [Chlorella vulgaris]